MAIHTNCTRTLGKAYSQVYNGKSRHISLIHRLVQGLITNGIITLHYVNTKFNLADYFSEAMNGDLIEQMSTAFELCQLKLKGKPNSNTCIIVS